MTLNHLVLVRIQVRQLLNHLQKALLRLGAVKESPSWAGQHLNRSYKVSKLPVLLTEQRPLSTEEQTLLMGLYREICNSWRKLTDVRFKLLGLVPLVSGYFLIRALSEGDLSPDIRVGIAVFGFIVTLAL